MKRIRVISTICHKCTSLTLNPAIDKYLDNLQSLFKENPKKESFLGVISDIERICGEVKGLRVKQVTGYCPYQKKNRMPRFVHPKCPYETEHLVSQTTNEI